MSLSPRQIEVFRMVMLLGSAQRAAQALHVSQPAVTQLLAQLEARAGLMLFDRRKGRLLPTPEAHALMSEVERVYVGLDAVQRKIELLKSHEDAVLRVGALHAMGASVAPWAVAAFQRLYPRTRCLLSVASSVSLRQDLLQGAVDFAFMGDEIDTSGLTGSTFYEMDAVCAVPATHPLAARHQLTPEDLRDAPLVGLSASDPAQARLEALLGRHGVSPRFVVETPYSATQCALVLAGAGLAVTNPLVAREYVALGLRGVPLVPSVKFRAVLAFHPARSPSRPMQDFIGLCRRRLNG
jgi:DNA-binding transcriptional LysR family regulator